MDFRYELIVYATFPLEKEGKGWIFRKGWWGKDERSWVVERSRKDKEIGKIEGSVNDDESW